MISKIAQILGLQNTISIFLTTYNKFSLQVFFLAHTWLSFLHGAYSINQIAHQKLVSCDALHQTETTPLEDSVLSLRITSIYSISPNNNSNTGQFLTENFFFQLQFEYWTILFSKGGLILKGTIFKLILSSKNWTKSLLGSLQVEKLRIVIFLMMVTNQKYVPRLSCL